MISISTEHKPLLPNQALVKPGAFASGENRGNYFQHVAIRFSKVRHMIAHHQEWELSLFLHKDSSLSDLWRIDILLSAPGPLLSDMNQRPSQFWQGVLLS